MLRTHLLWAGREYHSMEYCIITQTPSGKRDINSVIVGTYHDNLYRVDYFLKTSKYWETFDLEIKTQLLEGASVLHLQKDERGNWMRNDMPAHELWGCVDVDISLTPFTNTLPINRMGLSIGESKQIKVVHCDLLNQEIRPLPQRYTRLAQQTFKYENVPNNFEAIITVDDSGFVEDYPQLFIRSYKGESKDW